MHCVKYFTVVSVVHIYVCNKQDIANVLKMKNESQAKIFISGTQGTRV